MQILSNLIFAAKRLSKSEMAMIVNSLNRWVAKKNVSVNQSYGVEKIVQMEWGSAKGSAWQNSEQVVKFAWLSKSTTNTFFWKQVPRLSRYSSKKNC